MSDSSRPANVNTIKVWLEHTPSAPVEEFRTLLRATGSQTNFSELAYTTVLLNKPLCVQALLDHVHPDPTIAPPSWVGPCLHHSIIHEKMECAVVLFPHSHQNDCARIINWCCDTTDRILLSTFLNVASSDWAWDCALAFAYENNDVDLATTICATGQKSELYASALRSLTPPVREFVHQVLAHQEHALITTTIVPHINEASQSYPPKNKI